MCCSNLSVIPCCFCPLGSDGTWWNVKKKRVTGIRPLPFYAAWQNSPLGDVKLYQSVDEIVQSTARVDVRATNMFTYVFYTDK